MRDDAASIGVGLAVAAAAAVLCAAIIAALLPWLRWVALAKPNARSSHSDPTPQGGGIAVVAATIVAALGGVSLAASTTAAAPLLPIFAAIIFMACIGAADDIHPLPVAPRLLLQALAAVVVVSTMPTELRFVPLLPFWLERAALVVAALWFVNLVNFMDGLDWMTVAEVAPTAAAVAIAGALGLLSLAETIAAFALCGAMLGFAYFNKPTARLFLGDVGSLPIGLLLGWLLLRLAGHGGIAAAILLPLYYLADATITLARRLFNGEKIWQAHRTHFYQRATERGFSVNAVIARVFAVNLGLVALAAFTLALPGARNEAAALICGAALVGLLLYTFARGQK